MYPSANSTGVTIDSLKREHEWRLEQEAKNAFVRVNAIVVGGMQEKEDDCFGCGDMSCPYNQ